MKRCLLFLAIFFAFFLKSFTMEAKNRDLATLLPPAPEGWVISGKNRFYDKDTLYHYLDGGAELYLSYGFKKAVSRTYTRPGQPEIIVDIFRMGSSEDAFGVFSHSREREDNLFGQGSQYMKGLLLFWKDSYYISLCAAPETPQVKEAIFTLARQIEQAVPQKGSLPAILNLLPKQGLQGNTIRYFHHYVWLNTYYFVAETNILHIDEKTDAILAKYTGQAKSCILLLVQYQSKKESQSAYENFAASYLPELQKSPAVQVEDGTWTACQLMGRLLGIVFHAPEKSTAMRLLNEVQKRSAKG